MTRLKLAKHADICKFEYCQPNLKLCLIVAVTLTMRHLRTSGPASTAPQTSATEWVYEICRRAAERLAVVEGIKAIVLGGSRARGTAREESDIDLGLYYDPCSPISIKDLDAAACEL